MIDPDAPPNTRDHFARQLKMVSLPSGRRRIRTQ
jgi:hypothetical protein